MRNQSIVERERLTQVTAICDVAVVGGGIAGIAAALSAARAGAKTLLLEQQYALGGLATIGMVAIYLPLCDGNGTQVSFGIAEELLQLSVELEGKKILPQWHEQLARGEKKRLECTYNPNILALEAERLLLENHVEILYGAQVCGVRTEAGSITHLFLETRSGRSAVKVGSVVDASGDGIVCREAGEQTAVFQQQNILAAWYMATEDGKAVLKTLGACDDPDKYKTAEDLEKKQQRYPGLTCENLSHFTMDAHRALLADFLKKGPLTPEHQLTMLPSIPQIRMTRRIAGVTELDEPDEPVAFPDSIGLIGNWKRRGPVYEIPFSCLHGENVKNLITAGRCISTTDTMWDNTRVIPACAVTGEAAGLAAAMGNDFCAMDISALQSQLRARGIPLHPEDLERKICKAL